MTTIAFTFPAPVAAYLNLNVPGFAAASGGGDTVAVDVPAVALPAPAVAGLEAAGFQVASAPAAVQPAAPAAVEVAPPGAAPAWHWDFAPIGGPAATAADPDPAVAAVFAQDLAQHGMAAANAFFAAAAANPFPADPSQIGAWVAQQQQAVHDYLLGA